MKGEECTRKKFEDNPKEMLPRERLRYDSAKSLASHELIAILLRTGTSGNDVLGLAQDILKTAGGLEGLLMMSYEELCAIKGVGDGKAASLLAAVELGRRLMLSEVAYKQIQVTSPDIAADLFRSRMDRNQQETFHIMLLDTKKKVITQQELFVGTLDSSMVHVRDIFRLALKAGARSVMVCHNHPSGDTTPSRDDILITKRIQESGRFLDVPLVDHIILGKLNSKTYLSMLEAGYLEG